MPPSHHRRRVVAQPAPRHARPTPARASGATAPAGLGRVRFPVLALAVAGMTALAAGAGAGAVLEGWTPAPQGTPDAVAQPAPPATATPEPEPWVVVDPSAAAAAADTGTRLPEPLPSVTLPPAPEPLVPEPVAPALPPEDAAAGLRSLAVPPSASGVLHVVPGSAPAPLADRPVRTVRVEVEIGLDIDAEVFAAAVMTTLNDPQGWGADGSVTFARTDGDADLRVVLASPALVDAMCAPLDTAGIYSCGTRGHAVLNYTRWVQATPEFADRTLYRHYLVNHEVGHLLGQPHVGCPAPGAVAPIMQQQTIAVAPCLPNGWPFPAGG